MAIRYRCLMRSGALTQRATSTPALTIQTRAASGNGTEEEATVQQNQPENKAVSTPSGRRSHFAVPSLFFPSRVSDAFQQMEEEMNNLIHSKGYGMHLTSPFRHATSRYGDGVLAVDVQDRDSEYVITADLPGIPKDEIKITVSSDNVLTISGERKQESSLQEGQFTRVERTYGAFQRSFKLPEHVDANGIKAKSDHGVLTLNVPKVEKEEPNTLTVNVE